MDTNNTHIKYYNSKGEEVPSVTIVIKIFGKDLTGWANWLGKQGIDVKRYVDDKAAFGTYIHSLAESYFNNQEVANNNSWLSDMDFQLYMSKFAFIKKSMLDKGFKVYKCELVMHGERCGGTADIIFYNETTNKYILLDFKTSKSVYETMFMQLGGYTDLLKETNNIDISAVGIILITKDIEDPSLFNLVSTKDNNKYREIFNKLLDIYYLLDTK